MIDLGKNPESLMAACDGTKFILDGQVFTLVCVKEYMYLSSEDDDSFDVVRSKTTNIAAMRKQEFVDLIRSKQYIIS